MRPGRVFSQGAACVLPWWCPVLRWRDLVLGAGMEQENLSPGVRRAVVEVGRGSSKGELQAANTASGCIPMLGTGTDRLVVGVKVL